MARASQYKHGMATAIKIVSSCCAAKSPIPRPVVRASNDGSMDLVLQSLKLHEPQYIVFMSVSNR